jgi:DNA-binding NarL/FixJ family response regulator
VSIVPWRKRILIVGDHPVMREGLIRILSEEFSGAILVESDSSEATTILKRQSWDLAIVHSIPGLRGLELILKHATECRPKIPVLVLGMCSGNDCVDRLFRLGAAGYLPDSATAEELKKAVK